MPKGKVTYALRGMDVGVRLDDVWEPKLDVTGAIIGFVHKEKGVVARPILGFEIESGAGGEYEDVSHDADLGKLGIRVLSYADHYFEAEEGHQEG